MRKLWMFDEKETVGIDGSVIQWEDDRFFTLTYKGQVFHGELIENRTEENRIKVKINHRVFNIRKSGPLDELISSMGLDVPKVKKLKELQSPMPGRVVMIHVSVGQELQVGDEILSLEAMKMENSLKAEGIGKVKAILVESGQVVEKGVVLIEFE
jgi:biotin carboxyl carrier protein